MLIKLFVYLSLVYGSVSSDSFYDRNFDYARFPGRVTDRDGGGNVLKIESESRNVKFFRSGDMVEFTLPNDQSKEKCTGHVRDVEERHFVVYVKDVSRCWHNDGNVRRGTQLIFYSNALASRVKDASDYRLILINRKSDFLQQLNLINNFIFSFNEKSVQVASEYDRKILEINKAKQEALDHLQLKKKESVLLQRELALKLDQLERDIESYRIENHDLYSDRWHLDNDFGLPMGTRPQELKD